VQKHPWIVKHCIKGERATQRSSGAKEPKQLIKEETT